MNSYIKLFWDSFKNTKFFMWCESFYGWIIHILFKGKWMPKLLAYGGLHFFILVILGYKAYSMWNEMNKNNVTSFNQIIYRFYGDTLHNYRMNHLNFEKDMRRRTENTHNKNDIVYYYGFTKNDTSDRVPIIKELKYSNYQGKTDLIAKVRYFTCNDIPYKLNHDKETKYDTIRKQIKTIENKSNHERFYYDISPSEDSLHIFKQVTHAKDRLIEWDTNKPCFSFWMGFILDDCAELNAKSVIRIKFNNFDEKISEEEYRRPLIVEKIYPQPTIHNINEIIFKGEELKAVIKQRGIYISGIDPEKKEIIEKQNMRTTVLLGTIIAFMLDILVHLVLKWRRLVEYNHKYIKKKIDEKEHTGNVPNV